MVYLVKKVNLVLQDFREFLESMVLEFKASLVILEFKENKDLQVMLVNLVRWEIRDIREVLVRMDHVVNLVIKEIKVDLEEMVM